MRRIYEVMILIFCFLLWNQEVVGYAGKVESPLPPVDTTIELQAIAGMQYDQVQLKIAPGSQVKLALSNMDDMSHNLVITKPGSRVLVVQASGALAEKGPEMDFIPDMDEVKWSIPVVAPGETKYVEFKAPDEEMILPFVCTYPGHGYIMYGAIYVTNGDLPPLSADENIPPFRKDEKMSAIMMDHDGPHPYDLQPPYFYRIFMPRASPASIAVRLTSEVSYCWDAGPCQLLYAWEGGFVDNSVAWKGHRNAESDILGEVFYEPGIQHPLRLGGASNIPLEIDYKGFRLVDGFPEFNYFLDGVEVIESLTAGENNAEIVQTFKIKNCPSDVYLMVGVEASISLGDRDGNVIKLSPGEASEFSVHIQKSKNK